MIKRQIFIYLFRYLLQQLDNLRNKTIEKQLSKLNKRWLNNIILVQYNNTWKQFKLDAPVGFARLILRTLGK